MKLTRISYVASCLLALTSFGILPAAQDPFDLPELEEQDVPVRPAQDQPPVIRPVEPARRPMPFEVPLDVTDVPGQKVVVRDRFAGWQQAGRSDDGRRLSNALRANWVMLDVNGGMSGQVLPIGEADVTDMTVYLLHKGRIVKETIVSSDGRFEFNNLTEGPHAMVGWAANAFFAFGFNLLDYEQDLRQSVPTTIRVSAFQNATTINTDFIRHFAPNTSYRVYGRYDYGEGPDDPVSLMGVRGLSKFAPVTLPATSIDSAKVTRTRSGGVLGRIHQLNPTTGRPVDVRSTRVMLLQGNDVVAATDVDNYGVFYFPQVAVGQYGLAAAGVDGMGLIGVDIADSESTLTMNEEGEVVELEETDPFPFDFTMVSVDTIGWLNNYAIELAYQRNLLASQDRRQKMDDQVCQQCEGSGCAGCEGTGICRSRSQSFEDWAANCLGQQERTRLGSGFILSEFSKDLRHITSQGNRLFENAFYGDSSSAFGGSSGLDGAGGYGGEMRSQTPGDSYFNGYNNSFPNQQPMYPAGVAPVPPGMAPR